MNKIKIILLVLLSFLGGIISAPFFDSIAQIFRSEKAKQCVSDAICVGEKIDVIHGLYEIDSLGGLRSIFCGKPHDSGKIEYIFLDDILNGQTCKREQFSLVFGTKTTRTVITVQENSIIELKQGPLHTLDL